MVLDIQFWSVKCMTATVRYAKISSICRVMASPFKTCRVMASLTDAFSDAQEKFLKMFLFIRLNVEC